ncbi:Uncharacterised protein [Klebsiella pneumoniae]|nr:Uncharacterised protein [Klebsiella pneumoniae]
MRVIISMNMTKKPLRISYLQYTEGNKRPKQKTREQHHTLTDIAIHSIHCMRSQAALSMLKSLKRVIVTSR